VAIHPSHNLQFGSLNNTHLIAPRPGMGFPRLLDSGKAGGVPDQDRGGIGVGPQGSTVPPSFRVFSADHRRSGACVLIRCSLKSWPGQPNMVLACGLSMELSASCFDDRAAALFGLLLGCEPASLPRTPPWPKVGVVQMRENGCCGSFVQANVPYRSCFLFQNCTLACHVPSSSCLSRRLPCIAC
jgi:hypothetical protein